MRTMSDPDHTSRIPTSTVQVATVVRYTFLDYFRSRRFYILLSIGLIISGLLTFIVAHYRPASFISSGSLSFYANWWGMSASFVVILSGIFFGGDAIAGEFQNKTGYFVLPNPIRRSAVYVGKWIAAFIASSIILLVFTAITVANGLFYGMGIPSQFIESMAFAWIYLIAVLGFTFFFSSLFKSSSYSILVTAILFLFAFTLIRTLVADLAQIEPWFIVSYGGEIIGDILQSPYPQHIMTTTTTGPRGATFTITSYNPTTTEGLIILIAYFAATAVLGLFLFERKEFN